MSSLQGQKRRIKSISNTLEVANAMELVSMAKLQKLKSLFLQAKNYYELKNETMKKIFNAFDLEFSKDGEEWLIVITSSLGLCGAYNEDVLNLVETSNLDNKKIIVFGNKGVNYFKNKQIEVDKEYIDYNENSYLDLYNYLLEKKENNLVKSIEVIYSSYKNNFIHPPRLELIYPFENSKNEESGCLIETNLELVVNMYIKDYLEKILLEAILSENASRNVAMHQASDNAKNLKDELILIYNKLRQQQITSEIRDIVAGGE